MLRRSDRRSSLTLRMAAYVGLMLTLVVGCADDAAGPDRDPDPDPDPLPTASAALVSAPVRPASAVAGESSIRDAGTRVFVSMPPATEPGGTSVKIQVEATGVSVTAPMVDGGFDPVAIEAVAGDSLAITVTRPSGPETGYARVPVGSTPVVVRTSPRHRRVDVPLNPVILVVFNQPMDPTTLGPAIRLRAGGVEFAGTVTAVATGADVLGAQFVPDGLLEAGTTYELEVSTAAQDRAGTPLASAVRAEFTTGNVVTDATLVVSTTTTGNDIDPNGYDVVLDGAAPQPIDANGTLSIPVASGSHTVTLSGATANCTVTTPTRDVTVEAGATVTVSFAVACTTATTTGALRVITSTTGTDLDADAYRISVDAAPTRAIGLNDAVVVSNLAGGAHTVRISGLSRNCDVVGMVRAADVVAGTTAEVSFDITCSAVRTGTLVVETSTTGPDPDADGYSVLIDDAPPQSIASTGTIQTALTDTMPHYVRLTGVSLNCTLTGGDVWREVSLSAATPTTVTFEVGCQADVRPSGTIAFTTQTESGWSIFTSQADGSGRVRIATGTGYVGPLAWSPDGERLAFAIGTGETRDIFVMNADGSNLVRRTDTGYNDSPTWSPDGRHIAFGSLRDNRTMWGVYVMDVDADWRDLALLGTALPNDPAPAWSPDGTSIAFSDVSGTGSGSGLYVMRADGSGLAELATGLLRAAGRPAWSPDGATIAVPVFYNYEMGGPILRLVSADGSAAQDLPIRIEAQPFLPAWSPDGTFMAFSTVCESGVVCIAYVTPDGRPSSVTIVGAWGAVWRP